MTGSKLHSILSLRGPDENARLATEVYQRLNAHKADNPSMGEVKKRFSTTTPLVAFPLCSIGLIVFYGQNASLTAISSKSVFSILDDKL